MLRDPRTIGLGVHNGGAPRIADVRLYDHATVRAIVDFVVIVVTATSVTISTVVVVDLALTLTLVVVILMVIRRDQFGHVVMVHSDLGIGVAEKLGVAWRW